MGDLPERLAPALGDRYRIERELGQGGMATVYLAQNLKHDRQVAIKAVACQAGVAPDSNPAMRCSIPAASHD